MDHEIERHNKVKLITEINLLLMLHDHKGITVKDFDTLYDMTVSELILAKKEIRDQLELMVL